MPLIFLLLLLLTHVQEGIAGPAFDLFVRNSRLYRIVTLDDYKIIIAAVLVLCVGMFFLYRGWMETSENNRMAKHTESLTKAMTARNDMLHDWRQADIQQGLSRKQQRKQQFHDVPLATNKGGVHTDPYLKATIPNDRSHWPVPVSAQ